jgi:hypothetical protein
MLKIEQIIALSLSVRDTTTG